MTAMMVYVVLTDDAEGVQGVFLSEGAAHRHSMRFSGANPRLRGVEVVGVQPDADTVYIAEMRAASSDRYDFAGAFGNHEDAAKAAGVNGRLCAHGLKAFVGDR